MKHCTFICMISDSIVISAQNPEKDYCWRSQYLFVNIELDNSTTSLISEMYVLSSYWQKQIINSINSQKVVGLDGIILAYMQKKSSLARSFILEDWIINEIVFIPKYGKTLHIKPKDFWPIILSFPLTPLEWFIDADLNINIGLDNSNTKLISEINIRFKIYME